MSKKQEYVIVDIETTGGNAGGSRITEIAIIIHNGKEVVSRWETLVNPEKEIPLPIFALTGITNEMVQHAPVFADIAAKVYELLIGKVFVAHSVNFDYSFVRHQLEACGYQFTARKLCTVRLSRKLKPGLRSYSLGNLCDSLGIPIQNRHRAGGDADATAILFTQLLHCDTDGVVAQMVKATATDQRLPPNLPPEQFNQLPSKPGVYYFHNQTSKVVYVGKAINIKKRVGTHFTGHNINPQRQHFLRHIYSISFEECATELMALLLECMEIKRLWPEYNRSLKRFEPKFGLFMYEGMNGYLYLAVGKVNKSQSCIQVFNREYDGIVMLKQLSHRFEIDQRFCRYGQPTIQEVLTEDTPLPETNEHNHIVQKAIATLHNEQPTFALMDKGRNPQEKSCIWVEKGNLYAMDYIDQSSQFNTILELRDNLKRCYGNHYMMQLIYSYAEKNPNKIIKVSDADISNNQTTTEVYDDLIWDD